MAVAVFAAVYVLIATEWVHRVAAALGGAVVMLAIGATDAEHAFFSEHAGIDWNVIFLLLGMMLIVAVVKRTGIFEFIAIWAARRARGRPYRLMVLLIVATGFLSAWLDNVTTVLLIAPVTVLVCTRLGLPVVPYLIAEVMACNIGGAATLIGDPPNIMIGSRADLSFNDFLIHMTPVGSVPAAPAPREYRHVRARLLLVVALAAPALPLWTGTAPLRPGPDLSDRRAAEEVGVGYRRKWVSAPMARPQGRV
ncbi:SLC13 family permease [Streptomyces phaeolivaceus]|uniref:SLC13 family permease n=1 Tax=Streptomyces phaeolivaceus TaxID=2653200 RepID=UPI00384A55EA